MLLQQQLHSNQIHIGARKTVNGEGDGLGSFESLVFASIKNSTSPSLSLSRSNSSSSINGNVASSSAAPNEGNSKQATGSGSVHEGSSSLSHELESPGMVQWGNHHHVRFHEDHNQNRIRKTLMLNKTKK
ncbi:hypothetical protein TorRG33x02_351100 [Trema orientale]|uniref:Uncharacterized protein n=1 Tax=Trema orientale TaxID=63057 RepID=A0A2P5AGC3_TREOI|nr:hypothetical protein TorRG33x02_351100 [Trema orientale]